jgi:hypothetical protein
MAESLHEMDAGGQLGLGNDFDYWNPTAVRQLLVGEEILSNVEGKYREWKVHQVSCGLNHTAATVEVIAGKSATIKTVGTC